MASNHPKKKLTSLFNPRRWGLPKEAIKDLGNRLHNFYLRFKECFKTKTRDTSEYAYDYISAQLRMDTDRNFTGIGFTAGVPGQNIQQFMSDSPWSAQAVYKQVQAEVANTLGLENGVLVIDESADEKAGEHSAGAGRQYNGRLGKVGICQVGTFLSYIKGSFWIWVEGELFLPKHWFSRKNTRLRKKLKIPKERHFQTKPELALEMVKRVKANGSLSFEVVLADTLYGRKNSFRSELNKDEIPYLLDVPMDTIVYLDDPSLSAKAKPMKVCDVAKKSDTQFTRIFVRNTERGQLNDMFASKVVWTQRDKKPSQELLIIRKEENGDVSYALSNKPSDTPLEHLASLMCQRWFIERTNQDSKSEIGFDEFQAQTYRAWEHHLALTILAFWFVAQTKFEWSQTYSKDPLLEKELKVDALPELSIANIRTLLKAVMPLRELTQKEAEDLIVEHLLNRTKSRRSRMRSKERAKAP